MSTQPTLAFIGAGNMARAIMGGLINNGYPAEKIWATGTNPEKLSDLQQQGLNTTTDNDAAVAAADIVILAVKPQMLKVVAQDMAAAVQKHQPLIVSVAAGILCNSLDSWLGGQLAIVRCMPNTPALVKLGASGLYANAAVTEQQRQQTSEIMQATGIAVWVETEAQLDAVTAVSGSGPAYYFMVMEAMVAAGEKLGLSREVAQQLTIQTAQGAAEMARQSDVGPAELRRRVTSPKGTTEQAIKTFTEQGLPEIIAQGMQACSDRSEALAKELGK
ncbi:pyrroline-5-carboxylate reductase [Amphritea balenae]|uniref:Pyrroline-5-carboxylate reductase n=1 Tax=Amphritea balenae TaxID=452629 RepID=A0A3P1SJG0_9GAMM|nr:pyrroline-5-carboxylate reductase [Amphritea balenae]RRC97187.1 pyrroline-5-carboxylate reductase [Amphritea balenae]GGK63982.1 pyrroline-5-carboxylate reductase [Amphritea balenae]